MHRAFVIALLALGGGAAACVPDDVDGVALAIRNGAVAAPGEYDAVARLPGCSGSLISPWAILTAGHCVCAPESGSCEEGAHCYSGWCAPSMPYDGVAPEPSVAAPAFVNLAGGPDFEVSGRVFVHPQFIFPGTGSVAWDYAVIALDAPVDAVEPLGFPMTSVPPVPGDLMTLVGYGNCSGSVRTWADLELDDVVTFGFGTPLERHDLEFVDLDTGVCFGDSGGPAIDSAGRVRGVASMGSGSGTPTDPYGSFYSVTYLDEARLWIDKYRCPTVDPGATAGFCADGSCPCQSAEGACTSDAECVNELGPPPLGPVLRACVEDVGLKAGLPASTDVCWEDALTVKLYSLASYLGVMQQRPEGGWTSFAPLTNLGAGAPSSMKVPAPYAARLCTPPGLFGTPPTCTSYFGNVPSLPSPHDNNVASLTVLAGTQFRSSSAPASAKWKPPATSVLLNSTLVSEIGGPVNYLAIAPGVLVKRCTAGGACTSSFRHVATGPIGGAAPEAWKVMKGVTFYSGRGFSGRVDALPPGTYTSSDLSTSFTTTGKDVTSLVVAPGLQAQLCWGVDCATYTGWVSHVGTDFTDRLVTSIVITTLP